MFEHILVPVDGSDDSWSALEQAIKIAAHGKSDIHGLFVADVRLIDAPYWAAPQDGAFPGITSTMTMTALEVGRLVSERGQEVLAQLERRCERAHVKCTTEYVEGVADHVILDRGRRCDLIVLGRRGESRRWAGPQLGSTFESVVRHSVTPVLAAQSVPYEITRILVAYDGSKKAADALQIAAKLAKERKAELILLTADDGQPGRQEDFAAAKQQLAEEKAEAVALFREGHAAATILTTAREETCDLIVLGAYGHSRFLETFFGSTVDEVVHRAICPVLICH
ncbi:MAG: universal stress protein [Chloroflexi bacterium]|nr:universal stress protein [Chloroflexota bacterium]